MAMEDLDDATTIVAALVDFAMAVEDLDNASGGRNRALTMVNSRGSAKTVMADEAFHNDGKMTTLDLRRWTAKVLGLGWELSRQVQVGDLHRDRELRRRVPLASPAPVI